MPDAERKRTPPPRRRILWLRATPIFICMMAALFASQYLLAPRFPGNIVFANGGLGASLIAGIIGAFLISRFATEGPPARPSSRAHVTKKAAREERRRAYTEAKAARVQAQMEASLETDEAVAAGPRKKRRRH